MDELDDTQSNPFHRTITQQKAIAILPKITGGISFLSSAIIIYMILQSEVKLCTPFRRIIFAMCVVDLLQSGTAVISTFSSPQDSAGIWGAMGNDTTCAATGFIFYFSSTAAALYIVSLICHYFFFVQHKISHAKFVKKIEPWLHIVPVLFSLSSALFLLSQNHLNQADAVCWIAPVPYNCINEPEVECTRGEHSYMYRWIFGAAPNTIGLGCLNYFGFRIYLIVKKRTSIIDEQESAIKVTDEESKSENTATKVRGQESIDENLYEDCNQRHQHDDSSSRISKLLPPPFFSSSSRRPKPSPSKNMESRQILNLNKVTTGFLAGEVGLSARGSQQSSLGGISSIRGADSSLAGMRTPEVVSSRKSNVNTTDHSNNTDRSRQRFYERKAKKALGFRSKEAQKQAFIYTGSFLICYIWVYINGIFEVIGEEPPFVIRVCLWFFFPLNGLFNIMIFIRPHVLLLMNKERGISFFEAVWKVVKSGTSVSREGIGGRKIEKRSGPNVSRDEVGGAALRRSQTAGRMLKRKTTVKMSAYHDKQPIHIPPPSDSSKPMSQIDEISGSPSALEQDISSIGDFESFQDEMIQQEDDDFTEFNNGDMVIYGEHDHDIIYDGHHDEDGLSYDND